MIHIYKKIDKTKNNVYGYTEVVDINCLNHPILLCLSGSDNYEKAIFGVMRAGAQAARVYTTKGFGAGFSLSTVPIDFLGVSFKEDKEYKDCYEEIVDKLLFPLLMKNGNDFKKVKKQARMINIFTYDNGAKTYLNAEKKLYSLLEYSNFSKELIKDILSQISLTSIATDACFDGVLATCAVFNDVRDISITNEVNDLHLRILDRKDVAFMYLPNEKDDYIHYSYRGYGEHNLNCYFYEDSHVMTPLSAFVAFCLENSVTNLNYFNLVPIDIEFTLFVLYNYTRFGLTYKDLLNHLDMYIKYGNSPKYTETESKLRRELDDAYKILKIIDLEIGKEEKNIKNANDKFNTVIKSIKKYSSDTTYYQILTDAGLWKDKNNILKERSDRSIREAFDFLPKDLSEIFAKEIRRNKKAASKDKKNENINDKKKEEKKKTTNKGKDSKKK